MPKDYKPVNDRTLSDVNQANRDAWDSGEFKHVADDGKFPGNANELHQATAQQHQEEFESNETRQQHRARTNIGRRGAGEEHSEREKKSIRHVAGSDVRHTPAGEQQLVRGGQVVSHHDESKKEMEGIAKQPESIKKALAERKQEEQRRKYHNEPERGEVKIKDKLVDVPGNWPGKHADVEAAKNSAERAGGAANFGPNIPGPPEAKDEEPKKETMTQLMERALDPQEKAKAANRARHFKEGQEMREKLSKEKDEEPRRAVHLSRTSKRTWRRGE